MSISSSGTRKSGPYAGNGGTTAFPFAFKVFQASDVLVVQTDTTPADHTLALNTDYTVALNANQDANPGGTVNTAVAPPSGYLLTIGSNVPELQSVTLTNNGGFYPTVINTALDYLTILIQQLSEKVGRALVMPFSTNASGQLPPVAPGQLLGWKADGTGIDNVGASGVGAGSIVASNMAAGATGTALSADTRAANAKAAPADADLVPLFDSASFWYLKGLTWANLKATLTNTFLTITSAASTYLTQANASTTYAPIASTPVVGGARNLKCSIPAASASATFIADEVIVESALGGPATKLGSYSEVLNLATVGAGGMDTGTAPVSGFLNVYAGFGPSGMTIFGQNAATNGSPAVYGGAYMPAGYTKSALLAIVPTNVSGQIVPGFVEDREFCYQTFPAVFTGHTSISAATSFSVSAQAPAGARKASYAFGDTSNTAGQGFCCLAGDAIGSGAKIGDGSAGANVPTIAGMPNMCGYASLDDVPLITAQTVYVTSLGNSAGNATNNLYVGRYSW